MIEERVKSYQFRQEYSRMVGFAATKPVVVTVYNHPEAVLISWDEYRRVRALLYKSDEQQQG